MSTLPDLPPEIQAYEKRLNDERKALEDLPLGGDYLEFRLAYSRVKYSQQIFKIMIDRWEAERRLSAKLAAKERERDEKEDYWKLKIEQKLNRNNL